MGKLTRLVSTASAAAALVFAASVPARAYDTFSGHRLTYGVVNQAYWIDGTAGPQVTTINSAWARWNATSTPVSWSRTTTKSASHMDFYKSASINPWWGKTYWYIDTSTVNPENTSWWWAKVFLDGDFANCPKPVGTVVHEAGHGMGLAHVFSGSAVMRADIDGMATSPTADDINGINALY